jgi:hypothetical protein
VSNFARLFSLGVFSAAVAGVEAVSAPAGVEAESALPVVLALLCRWRSVAIYGSNPSRTIAATAGPLK